jgi:3-oxoadipate CoA-transferase beta subunit
VQGAKRVAVMTDHVPKDGRPKLLKCCTLPLTGAGGVARVYSSLAVIDILAGRFMLREKRPTLTCDSLRSITGAILHLDRPVADLLVPEL